MPRSASATRPDNQRLEFLGDRVLGLVMAEALLDRRHRRQRRPAGAPLQRAGAQGNLRRRGARGGPGRGAEAGPVRDAVGRAAQRGAAGRRDGGGDCRRLSGCGLRGRTRAGPAALGRADRRGGTATRATPRPRCRNGRRRAACRRRPMPKRAAPAPTTSRCSPCEVRLANGEAAEAHAPDRNAWRNRRQRGRCWPGWRATDDR